MKEIFKEKFENTAFPVKESYILECAVGFQECGGIGDGGECRVCGAIGGLDRDLCHLGFWWSLPKLQ